MIVVTVCPCSVCISATGSKSKTKADRQKTMNGDSDQAIVYIFQMSAEVPNNKIELSVAVTEPSVARQVKMPIRKTVAAIIRT